MDVIKKMGNLKIWKMEIAILENMAIYVLFFFSFFLVEQ